MINFIKRMWQRIFGISAKEFTFGQMDNASDHEVEMTRLLANPEYAAAHARWDRAKRNKKRQAPHLADMQRIKTEMMLKENGFK